MTCPFCNPEIKNRESFVQTDLSLGLVNLKPIVKDHLLFIPKRHVSTISELTDKEKKDLFELVSKATIFFRKYLKDSQIVIQDGPKSGQTINHVHIHVIPRSGKNEDTRQFFESLEKESREPYSITELQKTSLAMKEKWLNFFNNS